MDSLALDPLKPRSEQVEQEIRSIRQQIVELQQRALDIQVSCKHTKVQFEHKANTGNYDPSSDSDWIEVKCLTCLKRMSFDSERDDQNYRLAGEIGSARKLKLPLHRRTE